MFKYYQMWQYKSWGNLHTVKHDFNRKLRVQPTILSEKKEKSKGKKKNGIKQQRFEEC